MKYIVVVDMQKDFVNGALGSADAQIIVPNVVAKLNSMRDEGGALIFTYDTHDANYLDTIEGKKLPVPHCILGTEGWELIDELVPFTEDLAFDHPDVEPFAAFGNVYKPTFGSLDLVNLLYHLEDEDPSQKVDEIVVMGLCTDICVISNVMLLKAAFPDVTIKVVESCCAGVTSDTHNNAINAMKMCHIDIV